MAKPAAAASKSSVPLKNDGQEDGEKTGKRGWSEIENIFDKKKEQKRAKAAAEKEKKDARKKRDVAKPRPKPPKSQGKNHNPGDWVDDGLGGVYNEEGYTGRIEDGMKIFKAHVLKKPNAGETAKCPFDCDCCFI